MLKSESSLDFFWVSKLFRLEKMVFLSFRRSWSVERGPGGWQDSFPADFFEIRLDGIELCPPRKAKEVKDQIKQRPCQCEYTRLSKGSKGFCSNGHIVDFFRFVVMFL